ncbi:TIGR04255 family protein [Thiohalophilus sp.]|uniref:TIGR04255 family protein n=1 Tax=Thiohalophilus sp. TaxID=3028392 RepID=UPI002ACEEC66|nr:TIGR04255 family protein [Thiohalophilus sp.]MDZ7805372.1 TIGR04255 family protein [Thiohalophilus sp.]
MNDAKKIPASLSQDTILESTFEIRFESNKKQVAELLPGLLYPKIKDLYPEIEVLVQFNKDSFKENPELMYKPSRRLVGESSMVQLGERVISLARRKPYGGWESFKNEIVNLIQAFRECDIVTNTERFSMKYLNVLPSIENRKDLDMLKLNAQLGDHNVKENEAGFSLRTEILKNNFINIIQIIPNANVKSKDEGYSGLLLEIDTISNFEAQNFFDVHEDFLDLCHQTEKEIFFGIIEDDVIERLGPRW